MSMFRMIAAAALFSLSALSTTGCSEDETTEGTEARGGMELVASTASALSADGVTSIWVRIVGPGLPGGFSDTYLTPGPTGWSGRFDHLVPGAYSIQAQAFDANGGNLFWGEANGIIVQPSGDTFVNLYLRQVQEDAPYQNSAPFVGLLVASKRVVAPGETISIHAMASDDDGDTIAYHWSADRGFITSMNGPDVQFTAPPDGGPVEVTLAVDDGRGAISLARLPLEVGLAPGAIAVAATFVPAPQVVSMHVTNGQPRVGEVVLVDGMVEMLPYCAAPQDPLCYAGLQALWSSDCGNVRNVSPISLYGGPTLTEVTITAPSAECTVRLDLFDPASGVSNYGFVKIRPVDPSVIYHEP